MAERLSGKLLRQAAKRIPESGMVPLNPTSQSVHRAMATFLKRGMSTFLLGFNPPSKVAKLHAAEHAQSAQTHFQVGYKFVRQANV